MRPFKPCDALKPFVRSYMIVESAQGMENILLPDTSLVMAFRLRGSVFDKAQKGDPLLPDLVFSGLRNVPRIIRYAKNSATFLVSFKEGGARAFFNMPLHDFFGQNVSLDNFIPGDELEEISEKLNAAQTDAGRISVIETYLLEKVHDYKIDRLILNGVRKIKAENGVIKISELIKELYISKDSFEKRFRQTIGTSPKQFAKIIRLKSSISSHTKNKSLTETALDSGYYDQSHFIHDFKIFTGQTPLNFFRTSHS